VNVDILDVDTARPTTRSLLKSLPLLNNGPTQQLDVSLVGQLVLTGCRACKTRR
jgi:hypothetical protein